MTTTGANVLASLAIPRGCAMNKRTMMAQLTPTMVEVPRSGRMTSIPILQTQQLIMVSTFRQSRPWIAPRTDWAGVNMPSAMIKLTPNTARAFSMA